jgi:hypothetical protein
MIRLSTNNRPSAANHLIDTPRQLFKPLQVWTCLQNDVCGIASVGYQIEKQLELVGLGGVEGSRYGHQLGCATSNYTASLVRLTKWLHGEPRRSPVNRSNRTPPLRSAAGLISHSARAAA